MTGCHCGPKSDSSLVLSTLRPGNEHSLWDGNGPVWDDRTFNVHPGGGDGPWDGALGIGQRLDNTRTQPQLSRVGSHHALSCVIVDWLSHQLPGSLRTPILVSVRPRPHFLSVRVCQQVTAPSAPQQRWPLSPYCHVILYLAFQSGQ